MTPLALFVVLSLATSRVVRLVQSDRVTKRWREAVFNRYPPDAVRQAREAVWEPKLRDVAFKPRHGARWPDGGYLDVPPVSRFGYWLGCPWCLGLALSAAAVLVAMAFVSVPLPVAWWLAISTVVGLIGERA